MTPRADERRIVGGRYELSRVAGSGGAGRVYQAVDLQTGAIVAVKILLDRYGADVERFKREAALLERTHHEGIVRYLGHGEAEDGRPFLVMEWLDGVPLSEALDDDFGLARSVALMKRVGAALAHAHREGIVHRDIKPSNVFLVGGRAELAKLIDFGLALGPGANERITGTGVPVGTPAYMAPELVQGLAGASPASDVFSLGALFHRCLTGQAPFNGPNIMAVLAKVVVSQPAPIRDLRPATPASIERLVTRMMQKEPTDRFRDAGEFVAALVETEASVHEEADQRPSSSSLGIDERRLISVLMADGVDLDRADLDLDPLATHYMADVRALPTGQLVFVFGGTGEASDLVSRAARCALELRARLPAAKFAVMTGQGDPRRQLAGDHVIDSAVVSLGGRQKRGSIVLDITTMNLLDARFATRQEGSLLYLEAFREPDEPGRLLLGRSTPFVGRKREVRMALTCFEGCVEDRLSSVLLITGKAGIGKSRLREEVVERMRQSASSPQIFLGRPDAVYGGAFDLARRLVAAAAGLRPEFPAVAVLALVRARLERVMEPSEAQEHALFLSELAGAPPDTEADIDMAVVRSNSKLLGDRMKHSFGKWLAAEASAHPTVLVLEDFDYADLASIELCEEALRQAKNAPLFVLGLARPTPGVAAPAAFREARRVELTLGPLPEAAVLELVRAVADDLEWLDSDSLTERSGGNPLLIEELIRSAAMGRASAAPQSVLAVLQSRFEMLAPQVRRVARLGSVFGESFTKGAILAISGHLGESTAIDRALQLLVENEIVERVESSSAVPPSYRFRSTYWREAAYASLTDADRVSAHRYAGEYLASRGGASPLELAHHFENGRDPRACEAYAAAASLALASGDIKTTLGYVDRAVSLVDGGGVIGRLRQIEAEAQRLAGSNERVVGAAREALAVLPRGSGAWLSALGELAAAEGKMGRHEAVSELVEALDSTPIVAGLEGVRAIAAARAAMQLAFCGDPAGASRLLETNAPDVDRLDPGARGYVFEAAAIIAGVVGRKGDRVRLAQQAVAAFEEGRDFGNAALLGGSVGFALNEVGMYERAKTTLSRAIALADSVGAKNAVTVARAQLARARLRTGERERGEGLLREAIRELIEQKSSRLEGVARVYLAESLLDVGELKEADLQLRRGMSLVETAAPLYAPALAVFARLKMMEGRLDEAVELVDRAAEITRTVSAPSGEGMVRHVRVQVLEAAGKLDEARAARERAKAWITARAEELQDEELAAAFLAIAEHRALFDDAQPQDEKMGLDQAISPSRWTTRT